METAEKVFKSYLKNLGTQTRPAKDWVTDVIIHKLEEDAKIAFLLLDAASVTSDGFEFFGSSPKFLIDDRFYKKIGQSAKKSNELLAEQCSNLGYALLDYRVNVVQSMKEPITFELEDLCANLYALQAETVDSGSRSSLLDFIGGLRE